jgi:hypothetical protein
MDAEPVPVDVATLPKFSNNSPCAKCGRRRPIRVVTSSAGRTFTGCARAGMSESSVEPKERRRHAETHAGAVAS